MRYTVAVAGEKQGFSCAPEQNLLQGMRDFRLGVPLLDAIPVGCRGGGCGICRIRILAGEYGVDKMSRKHVPEEDQADGIALACRVYPRSDLAIEVLSLPDSLDKRAGGV